MSELLISNDLITQCNEISAKSHEEDFEKLAILLDRKSLSISDLVSKASNYMLLFRPGVLVQAELDLQDILE